MTRNQINVALCALIATLADAGEAPEGILYAALQARDPNLYDLRTFESLVELMVGGGLVRRAGGHVLRVTEKGRAVGRQIEAHARGQVAS